MYSSLSAFLCLSSSPSHHVLNLTPREKIQKKMATHSNILALEIPWTKEPGGLSSTGSQRVGHNWVCRRQRKAMIFMLSDSFQITTKVSQLAFITPTEWILYQFSSVQFSSVQSLSCVRLFATPWTAAHQASLSITNSQRLLKLMSIESVMPSNYLIPLSTPSPLALNLSQHQGLFKWVSSLHQVAKGLEFQLQPSVFPMNAQDWFPLGWTGWISLQSKGLSRVFSNTTQFNSKVYHI